MIHILLQVLILEYSISAMEDLPIELKSITTENNSGNMSTRVKVDKTDDQMQNLLDICLLITEDTPSFLKKVEKCNRNFSSANENKTFTLNFCNSMLGESDSKTKTLVENGVPDLIFDRHFAEQSWNGPADVDVIRDAPEVEYIAMEKTLLDRPYKHSTKLANIESNLELKMDGEWIEKDPKVSYKSHIYIGTSKFPLSFKTSRIINAKESALGFLGGLGKPESNTTSSKIN